MPLTYLSGVHQRLMKREITTYLIARLDGRVPSLGAWRSSRDYWRRSLGWPSRLRELSSSMAVRRGCREARLGGCRSTSRRSGCTPRCCSPPTYPAAASRRCPQRHTGSGISVMSLAMSQRCLPRRRRICTISWNLLPNVVTLHQFLFHTFWFLIS